MITLGKYGFERLDDRNIGLGIIDKKTGELKPNTLTYHGSIPAVLRAARERILQDKAFYGTEGKNIPFEKFMEKLAKSCHEFDKMIHGLDYGSLEIPEPLKQAAAREDAKPVRKRGRPPKNGGKK